MAMTLAGFLRQRHFDANANPLAGGKLYTYQAGTTTPQATYTDSSGGTPNANPVVLDSSGYAAVWLDPSLSYKFVLKDSSDVVQWTTDNVVGLLTADAVNTASLQAGCVTTPKLADDSVDSTKLKDDASVDGNRAVTTNHIRDANVTRAKLASGAVAAETVTASKTANYTATNADDVIPCSASGGAFTVTLYAASGNSGRRLTIKKTDSSFNAVTIDANASETIDGALTTTLNTQYEAVTLICDGSNWHIEKRYVQQVWTTFTPTCTGLGTVSGVEAAWMRVGDTIKIKNKHVLGTTTAVEARVALPSGLTIDTTKSGASIRVCGVLGFGANGSDPDGAYVLATGGNSYLQFGYRAAARYTTQSVLGTELGSASEVQTFIAEVPISGWNG